MAVHKTNHHVLNCGLLKFLLFNVAVMLSGCVTYTVNQDEVEQYMHAQQPDEALAKLESRRLNGRDQAVFALDKGVLLRMMGDFSGSNASLEKAKQISAELEAVSLREQSKAMSVNDAMRSYLPPPFERALIYCLKAINYLELHDGNAARVEVLQLDEFFKQRETLSFPFARYVSGLVFDFNDEPDNALIAYRKAYEAYLENMQPVPLVLQQDLLRLTEYLGLGEEHQELKEQFPVQNWPRQKTLRKNNAVIAFVFNGLIPRKHSKEINAQSPDDGQLYRLAVPYYEKRRVLVRQAILKAGNLSSSLDDVAQLDYFAEASLKEELPKIMTRAFVRLAAKNTMVNKAREENPMVGLALNIATFVSEQADTRAWYTLPQEIKVGRIFLPQEYQGELELYLSGSSKPGNSKAWSETSAQSGKMQVISWHWPESIVTHRMP